MKFTKFQRHFSQHPKRPLPPQEGTNRTRQNTRKKRSPSVVVVIVFQRFSTRALSCKIDILNLVATTTSTPREAEGL